MTERNRPTVLILDDEEMVCASLRTFLELETDYHVHTFNVPAEALTLIEAESVDVIVADFMMPGMDGVEFLTRARAIRPHATRVLLTGYADIENAVRAINHAGLYHYLQKPWHNEEFKIVLRNGIERSSLVNELDARIRALEDANEDLSEIRRRLLRAFI
jgi:DNA-binding NtrC family response regulator